MPDQEALEQIAEDLGEDVLGTVFFRDKATLLVAASVALPAWLVLRDGEQRAASLRATVQANAVREAMESAAAPLAEALRGVARDAALSAARASGDEQALRQRLGALRDESAEE